MRYAFVLDFSGETLNAGFVSEDLEASGLSRLDLANFQAGDASPMEKLTALLAAKMRTAPGDVAAVCISSDCDLSPDRRSVVDSPNAIWLNGKPIVDILGQSLGKPVFLERRAHVSLNYDRVLLGLPAESVIIGCYINDGYESAIWCRGAMLAGRSGAAGNIGHMPVHGREDNCRCGKAGCVELYGAGYRLKQLHSLIFPDIQLEELFVQHAEHPLLQDFLNMMAYPLAVEANVLDPDFIVIGGFIPTLPNFPMRNLESSLRQLTYQPYPSETLALTPSAIRDGDCILCAAHYAFEKLGVPAR